MTKKKREGEARLEDTSDQSPGRQGTSQRLKDRLKVATWEKGRLRRRRTSKLGPSLRTRMLLRGRDCHDRRRRERLHSGKSREGRWKDRRLKKGDKVGAWDVVEVVEVVDSVASGEATAEKPKIRRPTREDPAGEDQLERPISRDSTRGGPTERPTKKARCWIRPLKKAYDPRSISD